MIARFYTGLFLGLLIASSAFAAFFINLGFIVPAVVAGVCVVVGTLFCIIEG